MNTRIIAILLILSHLAISTAWANSHGAEVANGDCGDCKGYERPHIHVGASHNLSTEDHEPHDFSSIEQEKKHNEEFHEDGQHVHLVFEISRVLQWQASNDVQSEQNALSHGHFFHRTTAPPVPPPTA